MSTPKPQTIRLPEIIRKKIQADADKERRSFNAQVLTIIEKHYASQKKAK